MNLSSPETERCACHGELMLLPVVERTGFDPLVFVEASVGEHTIDPPDLFGIFGRHEALLRAVRPRFGGKSDHVRLFALENAAPALHAFDRYGDGDTVEYLLEKRQQGGPIPRGGLPADSAHVGQQMTCSEPDEVCFAAMGSAPSRHGRLYSSLWARLSEGPPELAGFVTDHLPQEFGRNGAADVIFGFAGHQLGLRMPQVANGPVLVEEEEHIGQQLENRAVGTRDIG